MERRKRCLKEIIPFIHTSAIWGQDPVFTSSASSELSGGQRLQSDGCRMAGILCFLPELPRASPAYAGGLQLLMTVPSFVYCYCRKYFLIPVSFPSITRMPFGPRSLVLSRVMSHCSPRPAVSSLDRALSEKFPANARSWCSLRQGPWLPPGGHMLYCI